jgi:hypothetical protein
LQDIADSIKLLVELNFTIHRREIPMLEVTGYFMSTLVGLAALSLLYYQVRTGVPPMPATFRERKDASKFLGELSLSPSTVVYELGCGWGSLLSHLSRRHPELRYVGIEISLIPFFCSKIRFWGKKNIEIKRADFLNSDFAEADVVICYLMRAPMKKLEHHIQNHCLSIRKGRPLTLITLAFWLKNKKPLKTTSYGPGVAVYEFIPLEF